MRVLDHDQVMQTTIDRCQRTDLVVGMRAALADVEQPALERAVAELHAQRHAVLDVVTHVAQTDSVENLPRLVEAASEMSTALQQRWRAAWPTGANLESRSAPGGDNPRGGSPCSPRRFGQSSSAKSGRGSSGFALV